MTFEQRRHKDRDELINGSELSIIPKYGHVPPRETEEFNQIVLDFLVKKAPELMDQSADTSTYKY